MEFWWCLKRRGLQCAHVWSSRAVGASLFQLWPSHLERPHTYIQMAHTQGAMIVNFKKVSQALHNSFSAAFTNAFHHLSVTVLLIGLAPSFCWFASSSSALIMYTHRPCGAACALITFAGLALAPVCTTSNLLGALHLYFSPQIAHHQLQCSLPTETHHMLSSTGKLLQFGHRHDRVTPPGPPAGAMIRRKKSVLFNIIPCTMLNFPATSFATISEASCILSKAHSVGIPPNLRLLTQNISISSHYFLLVPDILWKDTLVAIGLVSLPAFPSRHPSETFSLSLFQEYSHTPCIFWSSPSILHSPLHHFANFSTLTDLHLICQSFTAGEYSQR